MTIQSRLTFALATLNPYVKFVRREGVQDAKNSKYSYPASVFVTKMTTLLALLNGPDLTRSRFVEPLNREMSIDRTITRNGVDVTRAGSTPFFLEETLKSNRYRCSLELMINEVVKGIDILQWKNCERSGKTQDLTLCSPMVTLRHH